MTPGAGTWIPEERPDVEFPAAYKVVKGILAQAARPIDREHIRTALASLIDHTLLDPRAVPDDMRRLCREAIQYRFAGVCIHSSYINLCREELAGSRIPVFSVVGFPLGAALTPVKAHEAESAVKAGAAELDMVIHVGRLKSGDYEYVRFDIQEVVRAAGGVPVKVILETGLLSDHDLVEGCRIAEQAGARFVKTCTGFGYGGATAEDVGLMRKTVGLGVEVKAAGGIRSMSDALLMLEAGASRIGTSRGVSIVSPRNS